MLGLLGAIIPFIGQGFKSIMELLQDKRDKSHELALNAQSFQYQKEIEKEHTQQQAVQGLQSYISDMTNFSLETSEPIGIGFVDALVSLVRPLITYVMFGMYCWIVIVIINFQLTAGTLTPDSVILIWQVMCAELFTFVISYWFGERGARKLFDRKLKD